MRGRLRAVVRPVMTARSGLPCREIQAPVLDERIPVVGRISLPKRIGSGKQGARADGIDRQAPRQIQFEANVGKDVPQFAPNFTVYVLPPDVVCLYSEDRKFFLHGELYCALASAIAKGGKSLSELAAELARIFPPTRSRKRSSG
jgi:hypothetical protein